MIILTCCPFREIYKVRYSALTQQPLHGLAKCFKCWYMKVKIINWVTVFEVTFHIGAINKDTRFIFFTDIWGVVWIIFFQSTVVVKLNFCYVLQIQKKKKPLSTNFEVNLSDLFSAVIDQFWHIRLSLGRPWHL